MKNNQATRTIQTKIKAPKKQQGVVLIVALIMLLVVTIIGVSAVSRSSMGTQVAGNSMYTMLVYQGAESAIARSMSGKAQKNIKDAAITSPHNITEQLPAEVVTGGGTMNSKGTVSSIGEFDCPIVSGMASSSSIKCDMYEIDIQTNLAATAANAKHTEGRAIYLPSP
ncbi:MAG: pilus assembly PilX N-terminal domain-containing protein [Cocleimonas sp.]|nr:pilus assembly PilX N-terminal domain-containing protein [Cocleimonas sp.]